MKSEEFTEAFEQAQQRKFRSRSTTQFPRSEAALRRCWRWFAHERWLLFAFAQIIRLRKICAEVVG
jgi:hypothetical protein